MGQAEGIPIPETTGSFWAQCLGHSFSLLFFVPELPKCLVRGQGFWPGPPSTCRWSDLCPSWTCPFVYPQSLSHRLFCLWLSLACCVRPLNARSAYLFICSLVIVSQSINLSVSRSQPGPWVSPVACTLDCGSHCLLDTMSIC